MSNNGTQLVITAIVGLFHELFFAGANAQRELLRQLCLWLGYRIHDDILPAAWCALNDYVIDCYGGWRNLIRQGIEQGVQAALAALRVVKEEVVRACRDNRELIRHVSTIATKTVVRQLIPAASKAAAKRVAQTTAKAVTSEVVEQIAKEGAKQMLSQGAKQAAAQGAKNLVKMTNPMAIAADIAQAGLEVTGHKEAGKAVGASGNIAAGAILGSVAGPPGAAVGALGGLAVWVLGEGVGYVIERVI